SSSTGSRSSGSAPATRDGCRRTAPATRPRSGATSSGASSRANCSECRRPMPSNSGSTSACSTRWSRSGFPAPAPRWPRTGGWGLGEQGGGGGRGGHGLAVLVASEDALDQYFMREPEALLRRRVEAAILDHANPRLLDGHVLAAAFEGPIDDADRETLGAEALERAAGPPELRKTAA